MHAAASQLLYLISITIKRILIEQCCYLVQCTRHLFLSNYHKRLKTRLTGWFVRYGLDTHFPTESQL